MPKVVVLLRNAAAAHSGLISFFDFGQSVLFLILQVNVDTHLTIGSSNLGGRSALWCLPRWPADVIYYIMICK